MFNWVKHTLYTFKVINFLLFLLSAEYYFAVLNFNWSHCQRKIIIEPLKTHGITQWNYKMSKKLRGTNYAIVIILL